MKFLQAFLLLVIIAFHEAVFRNATDIMGVTINLPAMFVVAVSLHHSELESIWFGFAVGLVAGAVIPSTMGWQAMIFAIMALGAFHARERLNIDSPMARLSLIIAGVLLHNLVLILVIQPADIVYQMWRYALTGTAYSAVIASAFYVIRQSTMTGRRLRAL